MKKVIRTISGITPLALMLKPYQCPGSCIYCPNDPAVPKSYTAKSPVVLRAIDCNYDSKKQVEARLKILKLMGHVTDKIELIIMGGTFPFYPKDYQYEFIKGCFDGLNGIVSENLEQAKKLNETAKHRCVGLCLETRPDWCRKGHINNFLDFGCTRVEIGVQTLDDKIYTFINRGHKVKDVIEATQFLKDSCYKVGYHMMLGLPGSNTKKDLETFKKIFTKQQFQPDQIKIYPTFVIKGTKLEELYKKGEYQPYATEEIVDLIIKIKQLVPRYVRIMRIMRDIPAEYIVSSCIYSHLRNEIQDRMKETGLGCNCIRCREAGHAIHKGIEINENRIEFSKTEYKASKGKEIFLSYEDKDNDILIALLRLRIPYKPFRKEIDNETSLVREIHTFGPEVPIGSKPKYEWQHKGYGKLLLKEAEKISKELGMKKILIISGVGVKKYFINQGYSYDGPYVSKRVYKD